MKWFVTAFFGHHGSTFGPFATLDDAMIFHRANFFRGQPHRNFRYEAQLAEDGTVDFIDFLAPQKTFAGVAFMEPGLTRVQLSREDRLRSSTIDRHAEGNDVLEDVQALSRL